jgi:[acyl-carrier-protein] S-malonyltransferase
MKIGMLFPGYGSQYVGMAKELYDESRLVQEYFEEASNCLNTNFVKLCFASSENELARMDAAYTALFLVSGSIHALLKQEGIVPSIVAGYNLGEYSAIFAAGGFTFPDGLYLLNKYASFYQEELVGKEVAILQVSGVSTTALEDLCFKANHDDMSASIAIYKSPTEHVISGKADAVEQVRSWVYDHYADARLESLGLEVGLHSPLMEPVVEKLTIYLEKVDFKDLSVPLLSGVDAQVIEKAEEVKYHVINHLNHPSVWSQVMTRLADCDVLIEVGPGSKLSDMAKLLYPGKSIIAINKRSDIDVLNKILQPTTQTNVAEE